MEKPEVFSPAFGGFETPHPVPTTFLLSVFYVVVLGEYIVGDGHGVYLLADKYKTAVCATQRSIGFTD